jgi:hypothetical protein
VPEFVDLVFAKTSPKRSFSVIQNERFGLVFVKTGSIISGTGNTNSRDVKDAVRSLCCPKLPFLKACLNGPVSCNISDHNKNPVLALEEK